ncbi:MAG: hypothetical protein H7844_14360 [Nitrospirae bacterium YQR-1]
MKRVKGIVSALFLFLVAFMVNTSKAHASWDLSTATFDTTSLFTMGTTLVTALLVFMGVKWVMRLLKGS